MLSALLTLADAYILSRASGRPHVLFPAWGGAHLTTPWDGYHGSPRGWLRHTRPSSTDSRQSQLMAAVRACACPAPPKSRWWMARTSRRSHAPKLSSQGSVRWAEPLPACSSADRPRRGAPEGAANDSPDGGQLPLVLVALVVALASPATPPASLLLRPAGLLTSRCHASSGRQAMCVWSRVGSQGDVSSHRQWVARSHMGRRECMCKRRALVVRVRVLCRVVQCVGAWMKDAFERFVRACGLACTHDWSRPAPGRLAGLRSAC